MDGLTALGILLVAVLASVYVSIEQADKESGIEIIEQQQQNQLPETYSTQNFSIQWWREVYQSELEYSQRYYIPSLSLGAGFRHIIVPYVAGLVKGFNFQDGVWEWSLKLPEQITTGIHIHQNLGLVGGEDGLLMAFDNLSGKEKWRAQLNSSVISLSSGKDVFYAYVRRGHIYAIDRNGKIIWNYIGKEPTSNLYGASEVKEHGNKVYAGSGNGLLIALDKNQGKLLWQRNIGQPRSFSDLDSLVDIDTNILTDENTIYTGTYGGKLYAINPLTQLNIWQNKASLSYSLHKDTIRDFSEEHAHFEAIIALTNDSSLRAYKAKSGELIWENNDAKFRGISELVKYQDYWLGIDKYGTILTFNRQNGKLTNHYKSEAGIAINPVVREKYFYWLDRKGQLFSMFLQDKNKPDFVSQPTQ